MFRFTHFNTGFLRKIMKKHIIIIKCMGVFKGFVKNEILITENVYVPVLSLKKSVVNEI